MTFKSSQNREDAGRLEGKGEKRKRAARFSHFSVPLPLRQSPTQTLTRSPHAHRRIRIESSGGMDDEQAADHRPARDGGGHQTSDSDRRHSNSKAPGPLPQTQTRTAAAQPAHADSAQTQTSEGESAHGQSGPEAHGADPDDAAAALALAGPESAAPPHTNSQATVTPAAAAAGALSHPLAAGAGQRDEHSPTRTIAREPRLLMSGNAPAAGGDGSAAAAAAARSDSSAAAAAVQPASAAALPPQPAPQPASRISHAATALMVAYDAEFGDEGKSDEDEEEERGHGRAAAAQSVSPSQRLASAAHMRVGDIVLDIDERLCKVTDIGSDKVSDA